MKQMRRNSVICPRKRVVKVNNYTLWCAGLVSATVVTKSRGCYLRQIREKVKGFENYCDRQ